MVSGQLVELIISFLSVILTLVWDLKLLNFYEHDEGGLESGGKDNAKQTNELLLRALKWALPVL